jgi:hypothetical protein
MADHSSDSRRVTRRTVPADLYETTPDAVGIWHWVLASPMLLFLGWVWIDLFAHYSPIPVFAVDAALAVVTYVLVIVLPFGIAAFWLVSAFPRVFGHAGWDVHPLEEVSASEAPLVRYRYRQRHRAPATWPRLIARAGQGWVYLEITTILAGGVLMVPVFFSATEFGFGRG